jgi:uncharacterized membrane protein YedE/YeeE
MPHLDSLLGGMLIGLSALMLYAFLGRIAGISGISYGLLWSEHAEKNWRLMFLVGLGLGGVLAVVAGVPLPLAPAPEGFGGILQLVMAGLLVGFGTQLGNGCTSGHGVCGIARLSPRSIVSVIVFMLTGMLTATALQTLIH